MNRPARGAPSSRTPNWKPEKASSEAKNTMPAMPLPGSRPWSAGAGRGTVRLPRKATAVTRRLPQPGQTASCWRRRAGDRTGRGSNRRPRRIAAPTKSRSPKLKSSATRAAGVAAKENRRDAGEGDQRTCSLPPSDAAGGKKQRFDHDDDDRGGRVDQRAVGGAGHAERQIDDGAADPHAKKGEQQKPAGVFPPGGAAHGWAIPRA